ncbi:hypothetical protein GCM10010270_02280 [Streptomyces violaceus]|nr:hypothetical protein GCM10010270_02280 [Streptomyces janthinus]
MRVWGCAEWERLKGGFRSTVMGALPLRLLRKLAPRGALVNGCHTGTCRSGPAQDALGRLPQGRDERFVPAPRWPAQRGRPGFEVGVVPSSPLTEQFRFEGPDQLRDFLTPAFTAVQNTRFHTQTGEGDAYALFYRARVGSQPFEEVQLLRLDHEARIKEITLFGRPMPALTALMISAGSELARRQGRRGVAALMRASAAPVHTMVTFGDRRMVPLTRPAARRT